MPLRAVLVRTHSPGNLGSAARAVRNFGASLALLDPRCDRDHPDARAHASGAEAVLDGAAVLDSWDGVTAGAADVLALSALRGRSVRGLPAAWSWARARRELARGSPLVLVFGPERGGLTTEELRHATGRLRIPSDPAFPTLNLAQAVAVTLALLRTSETSTPAAEPEKAAPAAARARLRRELAATLEASGYLGRPGGETVLAELANTLERSRPTGREVTLWLGVLAALRRGATPSSTPGPGPASTAPPPVRPSPRGR